MNKLLATLIAGLVSVAAFAQAAAPVVTVTPALRSAHAATPAPHKKMKKHKAATSHKAKKSSHKVKKKKSRKVAKK